MAVDYAISNTSTYIQGGLEVWSSTSGGVVTVTARLYFRRTNSYGGTTYSSSVWGRVSIDGTNSDATFAPSIPGYNNNWQGSYITCTKTFTGNARDITVSWQTSDNVSAFFSGSGSASFHVPAGSVAPATPSVSVASVGSTYAYFNVSVSSYGTPSNASGRYIEAAILGSSTYGAPYRYATASNTASTTYLYVGNSSMTNSSNPLTITSNTRYYYGGYADNTAMHSSTVTGTFVTLPSTPSGSLNNQSYLSSTAVKANILYSSSAGGGYYSRTLQYRYSTDGGSTYTAWTSAGTASYSGTIGITGLPTSKSVIVQLRVSTSAGTSGSTNITFDTLPTHNNPVFTDFDYSDSNSATVALTGDNKTFIQGKSTPNITVSSAQQATASEGAVITNYTVSLAGATGVMSPSSSGSAVTLTPPTQSGAQNLVVAANDDYGSSTPVSKQVAIYPWVAPTINATATRKNNFEAETTISVSGAYSPLKIGSTNKNTITFRYRYKKQSTTTWGGWTSRTATITPDKGEYKVADFVVSLDNTEAYNIEFEVKDVLETVTNTVNVQPGSPLFFIGTDGRVAVGTLPTFAMTSGNKAQLEVNGDIYANGKKVEPMALPLSSDNVDFTTLKASQLPANLIDTTRLANGAVSADKLATGAVTNAKLANSAVTDAKINWAQVNSGKNWRLIRASTANNTSSLRIQLGVWYYCVKILFSCEPLSDTWLDLRAYDSSGSIIGTSVSRICVGRAGNVWGDSSASSSYIASAGTNIKPHENVQGEATCTMGNLDNWATFEFRVGCRSCFGVGTANLDRAINGVSSIGLVTGATAQHMYMEVWVHD